MEIVYILSIFCIGTVLGLPVNQTTKNLSLYEAIVDVCPNVVNVDDKSLRTLFDKCGNLQLTPPQLQEKLIKEDLLCLLFYNTFITYCSKTQNTTTLLPDNIFFKYNISTLCDNVAILTDLPQTTPTTNQQIDNLKKILDTKEKCMEICNTTKDSFFTIEPVCSLSYYYGHLFENKTKNIEKLMKLENKTRNITENHQQTASVKLQKQQSNLIQQTQNLDKNPLTKQNEKPSEKPIVAPGQASIVNDRNGKPNTEEKPPVSSVASGQTSNVNDRNGKPNTEEKPPASSVASGQASIFNVENGKPNIEEKPPASSVASGQATNVDNKNGKPNTEEKPPASSVETKQTTTEKVTIAPSSEKIQSPVIDNDLGQNIGETGQQQQQNDDLEIQQPNDQLDSDEDTEDTEEDLQLPIKSKDSNKPNTVDQSQSAVDYTTEMDGDSYFFSYFMMLCIIFIVGYICYHNKQKILALILEGRRGKRQYRNRRPNSANYHKLDSNLEEAITSSCNKNTSNVIY